MNPGTRLGPYEIVSRIGAGGMGEVFKARDTRLERNVAIKILPGEFAYDSQFRLRFEREAKTISKLNHPNICQIYDVGEAALVPSTTSGRSSEVFGSAQVSYLVMELLDGESLAERLERGPLPLTEILRYGRQIAEALATAHRAGIVHRDLKPGNIMITKTGAKLLDFGLAKLSSTATDSSALTEHHKPLTVEGTILGTYQYMAPEQLEGAEADVRSDIFALGAVLYEMATGKRAFQGTNRASVTGSIMKDDPAPPSSIRAELPASFDQLVRIALEKAPDARWQSAHDVALHLGGMSSAATGSMPLPLRRRRMMAVLAGLLLLAVLTAAAWTLIQRKGSVGAQSRTQFEVRPPDGATIYAFSGPVAISPNGRMIAYFAYTEGRYVLWIRNLDSLESRRVTAAGQGGSVPFWSPDSRSIGFVANGKMKAVDVAAGTAHTICDASFFATGSWNRDGDIIFGGGMGSPLQRVRSSGGKAHPLIQLDAARQELSQSWPYFLPDGRRFLYFSRSRDPERSGTYLGSLDSSETTRVMSSDSNAIYASPGYLLFASDGTLVAVPFDAASGQVRGERRILARDVAGFRGNSGSLFSASDDGVLAYATAARAKTELQWMSRSGQRLSTIEETGNCIHVAISPDDRHVVFESIDPPTGNGTIWTHDRSRGVTARLTPSAVWSWEPVWSADSSEIFYASFGPQGLGVYRSPRDGAAGERLFIPAGEMLTWPTGPTRDGSQLLFARTSFTTNSDLWVMPSAAPAVARAVLNSDADEIQGNFSPDSRWVAYTSNESGRLEVYVRPFAGPPRKWKVSSGGGSAPRWSHDGSELFFVSSGNTLMSSRLKSGADFEAAPPQALFDLKARQYFERYPYDVGADGTFLVNRLLDSDPSRIIVMSNWYMTLG